MEKMYRPLVLAGLLVGLIANAIATFNLKTDVADLQVSLAEMAAQADVADTKILMEVNSLKSSTTTQLAEHERLISQLENMLNYQLDN